MIESIKYLKNQSFQTDHLDGKPISPQPQGSIFYEASLRSNHTKTEKILIKIPYFVLKS